MALLTLEQIGTADWGPIDLTVAAGECVAICGPSGVGKTRLLRAIADLDPHSGEACLDGQRASELRAPDWRRQVAYLPAEPAWWAATARAHFAEEPRQLAELQVEPALLDSPIERLSSGERQRLALLRLLSVQPRVLLLDEPTANLDRDNTARVEALIQTYIKEQDAAVIWVSHDTEQLQRCCGRLLAMTSSGLAAA